MPAGRRSGRAAAKKAAAALEATPKTFDIEDESMVDADADGTTKDVGEPDRNRPTRARQDEGNNGEHQEPTTDDTVDAAAAAAAAADKTDEEAEPSYKEPTPPPQPVIRRKRLGRPPKNKPPDWDPMITVTEDTPRRRGRGGWRGRGGRKGGAPPPKAEQVIDAEGTVADIANDECVLPEDLEGETKVDKSGNLQGGRDYRCRVFTVAGRGDRLYMLSTEPARCVGFRDSYLFFTKHRKLYKIIVDDDEKRDMIERDIIPHSYKGRSIGIVTARSVFREFGARIVIGGKRIIDDYNVALARAEGAVEGQLADPEDRFIEGEPYNKNQYVAWHGASAVYHTNAPAAPVPSGKVESKKRKVNVNDTNWMFEHAREASTFNASINAIRRLNNNGVYDVHTNVLQYPATMQPTRVRIEQVAPGDKQTPEDSSVFPPVPVRLARNFCVMDTYMENPSAGVAPVTYGGAGGQAEFLGSFSGLGAVSDAVKDLLPPECRAAFDQAVEHEVDWKARWGSEGQDTARRQPVIDKAVVPYSMS